MHCRRTLNQILPDLFPTSTYSIVVKAGTTLVLLKDTQWSLRFGALYSTFRTNEICKLRTWQPQTLTGTRRSHVMYINSNRNRLLDDDRNSHVGDMRSTLGECSS
ncbi:unnamed protein product [Umbelopsis ramanniana]